jgi:hypothetical protein
MEKEKHFVMKTLSFYLKIFSFNLAKLSYSHQTAAMISLTSNLDSNTSCGDLTELSETVTLFSNAISQNFEINFELY